MLGKGKRLQNESLVTRLWGKLKWDKNIYN